MRRFAAFTAGLLTASAAVTLGFATPAAAFYEGNVPRPETVPQGTSIAVDPDGSGYWTMIDNQGISAHAGATFYGTLSKPGNQSFGTIVPTPDGQGYWAVSNLGGAVYNFGSAAPMPSFETTGYNKYPLVYLTDAVATPSGKGLLGVDWSGHVWTLGDAISYGDVANMDRHLPGAVAIRLSPSGRGYLIASAGGSVWALGDAVAHGGLPNNQYKHVTSMATTSSGNGYWLVDDQGGVTPFGDATPQPGTLTNTTSAVTYMAARPDGAGYYLVHENGTVDTFGAAVTAAPCPRGTKWTRT